MAVVLSGLNRLWIRNLLDESWANALRLVELLTAVRAAVTRDLNLLIRLRCRPPLGFVTRFSTRSPTISARAFVVFVLVRRGRRLLRVRPFLTGRCVWSLVPTKFRSELLVLFAELLILLFKLLNPLFESKKIFTWNFNLVV
jgi:hypothetical protein